MRKMFAVLLLGAFAVAQTPRRADCQMFLKGVFSASCAMPCCKANRAMPKCPMMKAEAPQDRITSSSIIFTPALQAIHFLGNAITSYIPKCRGYLVKTTTHIYTLFASPPRNDRAPPADSHLLNA